jgi:P27 family predicted phage terminase small subunit
VPEPEFPCPDWLDPKAKDKFHELVAQLRALGILERTDVNALVRYADAHVRWLEAALFMRQHGVSYAIKNDAGDIKSFGFFPQVTQYNQLATMLLKLEQELGLTPSPRTRIRAEHNVAMSGPRFHATAFQQQRTDELKRRLSLGHR